MGQKPVALRESQRQDQIDQIDHAAGDQNAQDVAGASQEVNAAETVQADHDKIANRRQINVK